MISTSRVSRACTPDADIEKGLREEHTERDDSHVEFSTPNSNYGITTNPAKVLRFLSTPSSLC